MLRDRMAKCNELLKKSHISSNKSFDSINKLSMLQKEIMDDLSKEDRREELASKYKDSIADCESEANTIREALSTVHEIRNLIKMKQKKSNYGISSHTGIRRGQLMKILSDSALTLPLFIGKY